MMWFAQRDKNIKIFHSFVQGRRRKLHLAEITIEQGEVLSSNNSIGEAAIRKSQNPVLMSLNNSNSTNPKL